MVKSYNLGWKVLRRSENPPKEECHWLQQRAICSKVINYLLGRAYKFEPGNLKCPTWDNSTRWFWSVLVLQLTCLFDPFSIHSLYLRYSKQRRSQCTGKRETYKVNWTIQNQRPLEKLRTVITSWRISMLLMRLFHHFQVILRRQRWLTPTDFACFQLWIKISLLCFRFSL